MTSKLMSRLVLVLAAIPAAVVAWGICLYSFNFPYWDQWDEYTLFEHAHRHSLTLQELFSQHNEHRVLFPRLILIAANWFAPDTDLVEIWIGWVTACSSALCLWLLACRTDLMKGLSNFLLIGGNVMLFNLLAWEDWLYGVQVTYFLPILCVIGGALSIVASRGIWQFFWAAVWSGINSFTIASGFTTWIIMLPLLLFPDGKPNFRWKILGIYLSGLVLILAFYLRGHARSADHTDPSYVLKNPQDALNYFLAYLGAPLADTPAPGIDVAGICIMAGGFLMGIYLACLVVLFWLRNEPRVVARSLPWLTISHFGLCTAVLTMVGRMSLGLGQALTSRYVILSSTVPIGLLFAAGVLFPAALTHVKRSSVRQSLRVLIAMIPIGGMVLYFWAVSRITSRWQEYHDNLVRGHAALVFINLPCAVPLLEKVTYPDYATLRTFSAARSRLGYPRKVLDDPHISPLIAAVPADPANGAISQISVKPSGSFVSGWAYLPNLRRVPSMILVTLPDEQKQDTIVGMAFPDGTDHSAGATFPNVVSGPLKWSVTLPGGVNLDGVKAWSFDGSDLQAHRLIWKVTTDH